MATLFYPFGGNFDGNGVPRAGATMSFFQTGTTTPQNTFTDSTLATPNANPVVADSNGLFPPIYLSASFDYKAILKDSAGVTIATRDPIGYAPVVTAAPFRSSLAGLTLSTGGGVSTFSVAAGSAADTTNTVAMALAASITKTTTAWVVGNGSGALDTGVIANATWYHVHLIQRVDTGVVDVLFSLSATTPTMPSSYTLFRRLGAMKTDGSAHWIAFIQNGDNFRWVTPVADFSASVPGVTTRGTKTITVPTGLIVFPQFFFSVTTGAGGASGICTSLDETDSVIATGLLDSGSTAGGVNGFPVRISDLHTNTSAQIGVKVNAADAAFYVNTLGWRDARGRDA